MRRGWRGRFSGTFSDVWGRDIGRVERFWEVKVAFVVYND